MGNRAYIVFFDRHRVSPTVYLHWHGNAVPHWLNRLKELMVHRTNDADYAAARFVGICHSQIEGYLSLGIHQNLLNQGDLKNPDRMTELSPGDAGIVVVDTNDFSWKAYGGYLAESHPNHVH